MKCKGGLERVRTDKRLHESLETSGTSPFLKNWKDVHRWNTQELQTLCRL